MPDSNIYLEDLKVNNYKSLKDSSLTLQMGLNVIIGPNEAGKSNLLDFIWKFAGRGLYNFSLRGINVNCFMSVVYYTSDHKKNTLSYSFEKTRRESTSSNQDSPYLFELIVSKRENKKKIFEERKFQISGRRLAGQIKDELVEKEIQILGNLGRAYIRFELPEDANWVSKPTRMTIAQSASFEDYSEFSFFSDLEIEIEMETPTDEEELETLKKNPDSVKEFLEKRFLDCLTRSRINQYLSDYTPISEIRLNPNINVYSNEDTIIVENLTIDFLVNGDWMPWSYLSDGTRRIFYLVTECLSLSTGIILVEEPELGIHPYQLQKALQFLKEQSREKQILISTHSPLALDILEQNELDRIIVAKYDKGTHFRHLSNEEIEKAKRYINEVGELSYYWLHSDLEK